MSEKNFLQVGKSYDMGGKTLTYMGFQSLGGSVILGFRRSKREEDGPDQLLLVPLNSLSGLTASTANLGPDFVDWINAPVVVPDLKMEAFIKADAARLVQEKFQEGAPTPKKRGRPPKNPVASVATTSPTAGAPLSWTGSSAPELSKLPPLPPDTTLVDVGSYAAPDTIPVHPHAVFNPKFPANSAKASRMPSESDGDS